MSLTMSLDERQMFLADLHVGVISIEAADRAPLTVPIWYDYEPGGELWVVTERGSRKGKLLERAGRFTLCVQTEAPPYRYVSVSGSVVAVEPSDVEKHTRPMAHRYLGPEFGDRYIEATRNDGEPSDSVVVRMHPEKWLSVDYGKQFSVESTD